MNYELDLSTWNVDVTTTVVEKVGEEERVVIENGQPKFRTEQIEYPLRRNLSDLLRSPGLFRDMADTAEAIHLAHQILEHEGDTLNVDDRQVDLLHKCMDRHLEAAHENKSGFGGASHEKLILRIYDLWKTKDDSKKLEK